MPSALRTFLAKTEAVIAVIDTIALVLYVDQARPLNMFIDQVKPGTSYIDQTVPLSVEL